ncbi:MAG: type II secretion system protein N [Steroidobacteraceae bacterium]
MQDIKRAKRFFERAAVLVIAAIPVAIALTYPGPDWFEQLTEWTRRAPHRTVRPPVPIGPVGAPITVTPQRPLGTDSSVSPVPLRLILVHTEPGRNYSEGLAQIGVNARTPQTYRAGAILANGARLSEIHPDYVILQRNGQSVRLSLGAEGAPAGSAAQALLTVGGVTPAAATGRAASQHRFTDYLRPSPVFFGGRLHGYALYAGRHQDPFFKMGLEPGDLVTRINGVPVSGAAQTLASLHTLLDGAALTVEIQRNGVAQILALDGAILTQALASPAPTVPVRPWSSTPGKPDFDARSLVSVTSH